MKDWKKVVNEIELNLSIIIMIVMLVVCTLGVFCRYILNNSLSWSAEVCRFLFMWFTCLTACYVVVIRSHLIVNVLTSFIIKDKPIAKKILIVINNLIWIAFSLFLAYRGYLVLQNTVELSPALKIPMKLVYSCLPIGCILMSLRVAQDTIKVLKNE